VVDVHHQPTDPWRLSEQVLESSGSADHGVVSSLGEQMAFFDEKCVVLGGFGTKNLMRLRRASYLGDGLGFGKFNSLVYIYAINRN